MTSKTLLQRIAILYQASPPPVKDGIQKPMKPGGYSDSGADIACELIKQKASVVTPKTNSSIESNFDWVFPDTVHGIQSALEKGANVFWLNTILYKGHSAEKFFGQNIEFIGQLPKYTDIYDDKWVTNKLLRENGLSVPTAPLISKDEHYDDIKDVEFPLVIKPIRGRGSQGVTLIENERDLKRIVDKLFAEDKYGNVLYLEKYFSGQEITVTVMPPGKYKLNSKLKEFHKPWSLPAVKRFNHINGIAPWNGVVAVTQNSCVLDDGELETEAIHSVYEECEKAASIVNARAPIRIDLRADENGKYWLFDLNMKPNMTGASRAHRHDQDSLTSLAARKIGWTYGDLLLNMVEQRWKTGTNEL